MKAIAALLLVSAVYLSYPTFDLWIKANPFASDYSAAASGFITLEHCEAEAGAIGAADFRCEKTARWRDWFDTFRLRDPAVRALRRELAEPRGAGYGDTSSAVSE